MSTEFRFLFVFLCESPSRILSIAKCEVRMRGMSFGCFENVLMIWCSTAGIRVCCSVDAGEQVLDGKKSLEPHDIMPGPHR